MPTLYKSPITGVKMWNYVILFINTRKYVMLFMICSISNKKSLPFSDRLSFFHKKILLLVQCAQLLEHRAKR